MKEISFVVYGVPQGKARPRVSVRNGYAHAYTPQKTKDYEHEIVLAYKQVAGGIEPTRNPVVLGVDIFYPMPKSWSKKTKLEVMSHGLPPMTKPDMDNVIKCVMDGLNGIAYEDDSQIFRIISDKDYSDSPRIEVRLYVHDLSSEEEEIYKKIRRKK